MAFSDNEFMEQPPPTPLGQGQRRFHAWVLPAVISLVVFMTFVGATAVPGGWLFVVLPIVMAGPALVVISVVLMVGCILRRRWRLLSQLLTACLVLYALFCIPSPADSVSHFVTSAIRVLVYRSDLQRQFEASKQAGDSPAIAAIAIDGLGSMTDGIAFDPTGEIALPEAQQSSAWKSAASNTELGVGGTEVWHIFGGYYAWFHY